MKTSCGTSVVLQGTQHEGALGTRKFFAFLSSDAPANKNDPELFEPEPVPEDKLGSGNDSEEQSEGDNVISCGPVNIL